LKLFIYCTKKICFVKIYSTHEENLSFFTIPRQVFDILIVQTCQLGCVKMQENNSGFAGFWVGFAGFFW